MLEHQMLFIITNILIFSDEIKIKLPPDLQPNDHILFTFYNVAIKKGNKVNCTIF